MSTRIEPTTIDELFFNRVAATPERDAVYYKSGGAWHAKTFRELESEVRAVARGLADWVEPGDIICLLSENRPEWWIADLSVLCLGGVTAPIYATEPAKNATFILENCDAKLIFVSTADQLDKIRRLKANGDAPGLERVVVFDDEPAEEDWVFTLQEVKSRNTSMQDPIPQRVEKVEPETLATVIHTSGTTGKPKGVMLSHRNIVNMVLGCDAILDNINDEHKLLVSFLPLSHCFERVAGFYTLIHFGYRVGFAESVDKLVENMAELRPTLMTSVPRIYEKLYAKVMGGASTGLKSVLLRWALGVGKARQAYCSRGETPPAGIRLKDSIAHKLVFSKIQRGLGGRLKVGINGGAPIAVEIAEFLSAVGLTIYEGYGQTEATTVICCQTPGDVKYGTVGKPWRNTEIKIDPDPERERDGEILVRGASVMMGYYNNPEATREVLSEDGWLRTGDIGYVGEDGYLRVTDRKKEMLKTAGGKYVAPAPIENGFKASPLVEQAIVIGDRRKYCVALLVPSYGVVQEVLGRQVSAKGSELNDDSELRSLYQKVVDKVNQELGSWEQIKKFYLLPEPLTQEAGELTPTLKPKRRVIDAKYQDIIESLYSSN